MIGLIKIKNNEAFNYILNVIKSCETPYHLNSCETWIINLFNANVGMLLQAFQKILFHLLLDILIEACL